MSRDSVGDIDTLAAAVGRLIEMVTRLEGRVARIEAREKSVAAAFERANAFDKAMWGKPMVLPAAPATDTDPAA